METIFAYLKSQGWEREEDMQPKDRGDALPFFSCGSRRCLVGPTWTTHYVRGAHGLEEMESVRTGQFERVRKLTRVKRGGA